MQYPVLYEVLHLYYQPCNGKRVSSIAFAAETSIVSRSWAVDNFTLPLLISGNRFTISTEPNPRCMRFLRTLQVVLSKYIPCEVPADNIITVAFSFSSSYVIRCKYFFFVSLSYSNYI